MELTYQVIEIARLNEVLKENGISDKALRKEICGDYTFGFGDFLDEGYFKVEGKQVFPEMCFSERPIDADKYSAGDIEKLHLPSAMSSFHEAAFGNLDYYFEDNNESLADIKTSETESPPMPPSPDVKKVVWRKAKPYK